MKRLLMRFIVITFCLANLPVFGQAMGTKVDIIAADEAALIAALDIYGSSRPKAPDQGEGTLFRYTADGANPATHALVVVYPSADAMDREIASQSSSLAWKQMVDELRRVSTFAGTTVWRSLGLEVGNTDIQDAPSYAASWTFLNMSDPETTIANWKVYQRNITDDRSSNIIAISADGEGGATHMVVTTARSQGVLSGLPSDERRKEWAEFQNSVRGLNTIKNRVMVAKIKSW